MLGDSGYANKNYLIAPLRNAVSHQQKEFNKAHKQARHNVECCIGKWKKRFPAIQTKLRLKLQNSLKVITATAIFHNICIVLNEPEPLDIEIEIDPLYLEPVPVILNAREAAQENRVRNQIINQM